MQLLKRIRYIRIQDTLLRGKKKFKKRSVMIFLKLPKIYCVNDDDDVFVYI